MAIKRGEIYWVNLSQGTAGLKSNSTVLLSQIRTIDKARLEERIGSLSEDKLRRVNRAIAVSLGLAGSSPDI